ncbi:MAG: hypothetical protein HYU67_02680 [Flavobacteriia bacterium]|nr:hypothetical protein [Flavobacteriia bacterium]
MNYKILTVLFLFSCFFSCNEKDELGELLKRAFEFKEKQNYSSALLVFKEAFEKEKKSERKAMIARNIGLIYLVKEDKTNAELYFKKGLKFSDKSSYYHQVNEVELFLIKNNSELAKRKLLEMRNSFADSMEVYQMLSFIYSGSYNENDEDLDLSLENALIAYKINANVVNTDQLASIYFLMDKYEEAASLFVKLKQQFPENKRYQFDYGQSLYFNGKEKEGLKEMQEAAERDSECKNRLNEIISE